MEQLTWTRVIPALVLALRKTLQHHPLIFSSKDENIILSFVVHKQVHIRSSTPVQSSFLMHLCLGESAPINLLLRSLQLARPVRRFSCYPVPFGSRKPCNATNGSNMRRWTPRRWVTRQVFTCALHRLSLWDRGEAHQTLLLNILWPASGLATALSLKIIDLTPTQECEWGPGTLNRNWTTFMECWGLVLTGTWTILVSLYALISSFLSYLVPVQWLELMFSLKPSKLTHEIGICRTGWLVSRDYADILQWLTRVSERMRLINFKPYSYTPLFLCVSFQQMFVSWRPACLKPHPTLLEFQFCSVSFVKPYLTS